MVLLFSLLFFFKFPHVQKISVSSQTFSLPSMPQITRLKDLTVADKDNGPRTTNDVKLINAGRILENSKTLGESRLPAVEVPGGVITMHVVVRPPVNDRNNRKLLYFAFLLLAHRSRFSVMRTVNALMHCAVFF